MIEFERFRRLSARLLCLALLLFVGACSALPSSGPLSRELSTASEDTENGVFGYKLVDINAASMQTILSYQPAGFSGNFTDRIWRPKSTIGVGDVISVVVWEPGEQGLFTNSATGNRAELGPFQIEQNGKIPVPYVGQVTAKGRTIAQVRWAIQSQLQRKAIDPQVVVSLQENASSVVSVNGSVRQPGQFPISLRGDRLLDVVAKAGGSATPADETMITFLRGKKRGTQLLRNLFESPNENLYVQPHDQIFLTHDPQTFTAFGSVGRVGEYPIAANDVSLIEALGRIGGLDDNRANTEALFVFRYESAALVSALDQTPNVASPNNSKHEQVPIIYKLNMREGQSYFFGQSFTLRDKDIIYVANSYGSELRKFIGILSGITSPALSTANVITN